MTKKIPRTNTLRYLRKIETPMGFQNFQFEIGFFFLGGGGLEPPYFWIFLKFTIFFSDALAGVSCFKLVRLG